MNHSHSPWNEVGMIAKLADMKEMQYQQALLLSSVIDLLIEKGMLTQDELAETAKYLDKELTLHSDPPIL